MEPNVKKIIGDFPITADNYCVLDGTVDLYHPNHPGLTGYLMFMDGYDPKTPDFKSGYIEYYGIGWYAEFWDKKFNYYYYPINECYYKRIHQKEIK